MESPAELPAALWGQLAGSQSLGLIGPRSLNDHVEHALGFVVAAGVAPRNAADLGSGGGLPALILAAAYPDSDWTLIDARQRSVARLDVMIARLGWVGRVVTRSGSAESAGHEVEFRGHFDLVTARGFGPPAMVAECAAPLLAIGGRLVVSEPPTETQRWPESALAKLGLCRVGSNDPAYFVAEQIADCPADLPRRQGQPRKDPLW